jgi:hypothetical protein
MKKKISAAIIGTIIYIVIWLLLSLMQRYPNQLSFIDVIVFEIVTVAKTVACVVVSAIVIEKTRLL